ncbi:MAG: hypothetical protein KC731_16205, partial [Myxococcales bacterium]|nr:hypothetical protein [Myxococcales bacterium]
MRGSRVIQVLVVVFALGMAIGLSWLAQEDAKPPIAPDPAAAATATDPGSVTVSSAAPSTSPDDKYGLMGPSSKADPHLGREDALREAAREGVEQVLGDEEDTE